MDSWEIMMNTKKILTETISGNLNNFTYIESVPHNKLLKTSKSCSNLFLTKSAVLEVITEFKKRNIKPEVVQKWATFMRCGYIGYNIKTPILPLQIEYKADEEDLIVEMLARLNEIGDVVDGVIEDSELDIMIFKLK